MCRNRDVVGLHLDPPDQALVLCVDEKSQVQALERAQPLPPLGFGYVGGVTHDYVRHGTTTVFADSDQGGVHWGVIASLIETCKLNAVDPQAYLADILNRLFQGHPMRRIDDLMPWAYADRVP